MLGIEHDKESGMGQFLIHAVQCLHAGKVHDPKSVLKRWKSFCAWPPLGSDNVGLFEVGLGSLVLDPAKVMRRDLPQILPQLPFLLIRLNHTSIGRGVNIFGW